MIKEEKKLLFKDLCARLPYGLKYNFDGYDGCNYTMGKVSLNAVDDFPIENIKPYLFPMSNMFDEQKNTFSGKVSILNAFIDGSICLSEDEELTPEDIIELFDFLNKNHFDYRGLIKKGLAIDATGLNIY